MHIHYIRGVDRAFLMDDSAILIRSAWLCVLCQHINAFHNDLAGLLVYGDNLTLFIYILAGDNLNGITLLDRDCFRG